MHVGLNLVFLVPGETGGMEVYARELLPALRQARPDMRLSAFVNRELAETELALWSAHADCHVVPVSARKRVQWVLGEQYHLPRIAARAGVDIVHSLASTGPSRGRFRRVTTVHDLIYRVFPEAHFGLRTLGMRALVPLAARASDRVIVDAHSTREDLVRFLGLQPDQIDVVPLGVGHSPREPTVSEDELRRRLDLGDRRVALSVSAKRPHKNLMRLLDALALIDGPQRPLLVLPGYPTPHEAELRAHADQLGVAGDVRFPAWVGPDELEGLYRLAACFVFPSLYEGFGLPVLEAMVRRLPVACSDRGSLAEVAGNAALLFEPEDPEAIAGALRTLLTDESTAARLRDAGAAQAARFSWERTARGTLETYDRVVGATPSAS